MSNAQQNRNGLPDALLDERRFFELYGPGKTDTPPGWNTPENWVTIDEIPEDKYFGLAICNNSNYLFIDWDHVIDPKTGKMVPWAREVYKRITQYSETYTEYSISGTGFHMVCDLGTFGDDFDMQSNGYEQIIVQMDPQEYNALPKAERDMIPKIEPFYHTAGRYALLTGKHNKLVQVAKDEDAASIFNELLKVRDEFHEKYSKKKIPGSSGNRIEISKDDEQRVLEALPYISANDYNTWVRIGQALQNCGFSFEVWDEWSRFTDQRAGELSDKYNPEETPKKWKSFKRTESHYNVGTVIIEAKKNSEYQPPERGGKTDSIEVLKSAIVTLDTVEKKSVEWLVPDYIPKNKLIVLGGDGGSGKTSIWNSLVADISSGHTTIFEKDYAGDMIKGPGKKVLFLSSEDTLSEVLRPRIERYPATLKNVVSIPFESDVFKELKFGTRKFEDLLGYVRPELLVVDPLQSFLEKDVIMGARNQMRDKLNHVVTLCSKYECTAIIVVHANKGKGVYGRKRLADSADIWDIARCVFLCGNADKGTFYVSQEKNNYGPQNDTLLYKLTDGCINVIGFTDKHDRDFVLAEEFNGKKSPALEEAKDFIISQLRESGGSIAVGELNEIAEALSISTGTLGRAKAGLKKENQIVVENSGFGESKQWIVRLA